jgi:hypothetical protein
LVDLVSNRGNQFSHCHGACDVSEIRLRLQQRDIGTLVLGWANNTTM